MKIYRIVDRKLVKNAKKGINEEEKVTAKMIPRMLNLIIRGKTVGNEQVASRLTILSFI